MAVQAASTADKPINGRATSEVLRNLLSSRSEYRRAWAAHVRRPRSTGLVQAAVAKVITDHLWDSGERSDTETNLARSLRDRVRRALSGENLTAETLTWFIKAFHMDSSDERQLWAVFTRDQDTEWPGIAHTVTRSRPMVRRQWHRTQSLFERYLLDRHGALAYRRTMHTIIALEDGVDRYLFNHEHHAVGIDVRFGGHLGRPYSYGGLVSHDIVLDRPLRRGQSACLEYRTSYRRDAVRPLEVRRPARGRSENVDIAVQFHPACRPSRVWWAVWADHLDGGPVAEEPADLDMRLAVHRFVPFIEQTAVGFRWRW